MKRSNIDALIASQEGMETINRRGIEELQLAKLNALLHAERRRGGFYRGLPEELGGLEELSKLPFTTQDELAANAPGLLMTSQASVHRVLSEATSGTSGAAKRVFYTEGDCERTVQLFAAGLGELIFPGGRTMICMPLSARFGLCDMIAEAIRRLGAEPLPVGVGKSYGELRRLMERERPDTFVGMPAQLLGMLRFCGRGSLERALVSGDACPESVLRGCERMLGTKLFPHYGSREMGLGGAICCAAHEGMHLRENHVIAEIVDADGNVLPRGERGELVITTIGMEAMPLIRYRTGDWTRLLPDTCPCGSEVARLGPISRGFGGSSAADEAVFGYEGLVDIALRLHEDTVLAAALTLDGGGRNEIEQRLAAVFPGKRITAEVRAACAADVPLQTAKRRIEII